MSDLLEKTHKPSNEKSSIQTHTHDTLWKKDFIMIAPYTTWLEPDLLTKEQREKLLANGRIFNDAMPGGGVEQLTPQDFIPIVRFYNKDTGTQWLLTAIDCDNPGDAWALVQNPDSDPAEFWVSPFSVHVGPNVIRDDDFIGTKLLSEYTKEFSEK